MKRRSCSCRCSLSSRPAPLRPACARSGPCQRRREGRAATTSPARCAARNSVWDGRARAPLGRAQRDRGLPGDGGGGRARASAPLARRAAGAAPARRRSRIAYAPPAADPVALRRPAHPALLGALHERDRRRAHADWVWKPGSPAAPRDTTGLEAGAARARERARRAAAASRSRSAPHAARRSGSRSTRAADRPAGRLRRDASRVTADGRRATLPVELQRLRLRRCPTRTASTRWSTTSPTSPSSTRAGTSTRPTTASRTATASSSSTPTTRRRCRRDLGRFDGADFTRRARATRDPARASGNRIVPRVVLRPGPRLRENGRAPGRAADAWMSFLSTHAAGRADVPLPARRALPAAVRRGPTARGATSTPTRAREASCPLFVTKHISPGVPGARSTSGAPARRRSTSPAAAEERAKRPRLLLQRRAPARARPRSSTRPPPRRASWPGPPSSTTSTLYFFWHGVHWQHNRQKQGERKQNVWANPITFDNRGQPNKPIDDQGYINGDGVLFYPGEEKLHPEEDRGIAGPGRHRAAREPAPRPAGPPVPDPGPPRSASSAEVDEALRRGGAARLLGRRGDGRLRRRRGEPFEAARARPGRAIVAVEARRRSMSARRRSARVARLAGCRLARRGARASAPADRRARPLHRPARAARRATPRARALRRPARAGRSPTS